MRFGLRLVSFRFFGIAGFSYNLLRAILDINAMSVVDRGENDAAGVSDLYRSRRERGIEENLNAVPRCSPFWLPFGLGFWSKIYGFHDPAYSFKSRMTKYAFT